MKEETVPTAAVFVGPVQAVGVAVTAPGAVDTLAAAAGELQRRAPASGGALRPAAPVPLVGPVRTVYVSVAHPQPGDAAGVVAPEGRGAAGDGGAGGLVAGVVAVRLPVAHEGGRHALTRAAAELRVRAKPES